MPNAPAMKVRFASHRARQKAKDILGDDAVQYRVDMLTPGPSGGMSSLNWYEIPAAGWEKIKHIKGVTRLRNQNATGVGPMMTRSVDEAKGVLSVLKSYAAALSNTDRLKQDNRGMTVRKVTADTRLGVKAGEKVIAASAPEGVRSHEVVPRMWLGRTVEFTGYEMYDAMANMAYPLVLLDGKHPTHVEKQRLASIFTYGNAVESQSIVVDVLRLSNAWLIEAENEYKQGAVFVSKHDFAFKHNARTVKVKTGQRFWMTNTAVDAKLNGVVVLSREGTGSIGQGWNFSVEMIQQYFTPENP